MNILDVAPKVWQITERIATDGTFVFAFLKVNMKIMASQVRQSREFLAADNTMAARVLKKTRGTSCTVGSRIFSHIIIVFNISIYIYIVIWGMNKPMKPSEESMKMWNWPHKPLEWSPKNGFSSLQDNTKAVIFQILPLMKELHPIYSNSMG